MATPTYYKANNINLKNHRDFNEKWVQETIAADPEIMGLGELALIEKERIQEKAGRLDLLFSDTDDTTRYEVELMLGKQMQAISSAALNIGTSNVADIPAMSILR